MPQHKRVRKCWAFPSLVGEKWTDVPEAVSGRDGQVRRYAYQVFRTEPHEVFAAVVQRPDLLWLNLEQVFAEDWRPWKKSISRKTGSPSSPSIATCGFPDGDLHDEEEQIFRTLKHPEGLARSLLNQGLLWCRGFRDSRMGLALLDKTQEIAESHGFLHMLEYVRKVREALKRTERAQRREMGEYQEALRVYDAALELDETCRGAWLGKAEALEQLGRTGEADLCGKRIRELRQ